MLKQLKTLVGALLFGALTIGNMPPTQAMETQPILQKVTLDEESKKNHEDLLRKVEKLEGDFEIYVGAGLSDAGEPIFFAMEKVDDRNKQTWMDYKNVMKSDGLSVIVGLKKIVEECSQEKLELEKDEYLKTLKKKVCYQDKNKRTKIEAAIEGTVQGISGFDQLLGSESKNMYVVYASKNPVRGLFSPQSQLKPKNMASYERRVEECVEIIEKCKNFYNDKLIDGDKKNKVLSVLTNSIDDPASFKQYMDIVNEDPLEKFMDDLNNKLVDALGGQLLEFDNASPLKEYQKKSEYSIQDFEMAYGDIIMCMAVRDNEGTPTVTHRGIFKNPLYALLGEYKDISLKLHGFSAMVAKVQFLKKEYMLVQPISNVQATLEKKFKHDEMYLGVVSENGFVAYDGGKSQFSPFSPISKSTIGNGGIVGSEPLYTIKLDALSKFYTENLK